MQTALSKSAEAGSTPDEATEAEIQAIEKDIAAIEVNIERTKNKSRLLKKLKRKAFKSQRQHPVKIRHQKLKSLKL